MPVILQPYELFIGLRYTRAKRRNHFISFISLISMLGMALGVMALIVVLSVMNGFQKEIRERMLGASPHLEVVADGGRMNDWQPILAQVAKHPQILASAPYVAGQGMLSFGQSVQGVMVRGIDPALETAITDLSNKIKSGTLSDLRSTEFGIVLGSDLARALGVHVGEKVMLIAPQGSITPRAWCRASNSFAWWAYSRSAWHPTTTPWHSSISTMRKNCFNWATR